ncbi:MAG: cation:proton antiporter [Candidatus Lernaella stagnicola]|nr:cation:proton antiporter [Candidatus Lernaella stagnicola]
MRYVLVLAVLVVFTFFLNLMEALFPHLYGDRAILVLGFVLLSSFIAGRMIRRARMPMITGYLLAGLVLGPHVLGRLHGDLTVFTPEVLDQLGLVDDLALGLIALTAGGELRLRELRTRFRMIGAITGLQTGIVLLGTIAVLWVMAPYLPFTAGQPAGLVLAAALMLAICSTATSPSTTIAVITEVGAKGPMTTTMMGVTVLKDVVTLIVFSMGLVAARKLLHPQSALDFAVLLHVVWEIFGSLVIGLLLGVAIGFYIRYIGRELPSLILALSFLSMKLGAQTQLSGILICVSAGFYIENFTDHGEQMIEAIERYSLPVYIVFFTLAGAKINIDLLRDMWQIALLLIAARLLFTYLGTYFGVRLVGGSVQDRRLTWMGFIGQAGITLGLATIIGRVVPDIGTDLRTLIIAVIAINQLIGPIMLRFALYRGGEAKA